MDSSAESKTIADRITGVLKHLPGGALLFAVIPLLVLGYLGWYYYGAAHLDHVLYSLKAENLTVTKQPEWINSNIVKDVFEDSALDQISLLDPHSTATIAHAFQANPWVKTAPRVTKSYGGEVRVDLVYRQPIACVNVAPPDSPKSKFFVIDDEGIMLPSEFEPDDLVRKYFLIFADDARYQGEDAGMPFGDQRVKSALELCKFLFDVKEPLGLQCVYIDPDAGSGSSSPWLLSISTIDRSRRIIWGHAPGTEARSEPSPDVKLQRLRRWLRETTATEKLPLAIDLRRSTAQSAVSFEH